MEPLKRVALHPEARAELQDSVSFYREQSGEALADRFKRAVESAFRAISENPSRFAPAPDAPEAHVFRLKAFPFSIVFIDRPRHVWVVAVAHGRRKPGYWAERMD